MFSHWSFYFICSTLTMEQAQIDSKVSSAYVDKLKAVINLLYNDIPDEYDDTINTKLLDSIKSQIASNDGSSSSSILLLANYLQWFFFSHETNFSLVDLFTKDIQIQTFFVNLMSVVYAKTANTPNTDSTNRLVYEFICNFIRTYNQNFTDLDTSVKHSILNLIKVFFDMGTEYNDQLTTLIRDNYFQVDFFDDKSLFIRRLLVDLFTAIFVYLHEAGRTKDLNSLISNIFLNVECERPMNLLLIDFVQKLISLNMKTITQMFYMNLNFNLTGLLQSLHDLNYIRFVETKSPENITCKQFTCGYLLYGHSVFFL
jgi:hypothetical protein